MRLIILASLLTALMITAVAIGTVAQESALSPKVLAGLKAGEKLFVGRGENGQLRGFKIPASVESKIDRYSPLDNQCSWGFFGETWEYDAATGLYLRTTVWWSDACGGAICYTWYGDCGVGCQLGGECVYDLGSWILN